MVASKPEDLHPLFAEAVSSGDVEALLSLFEPEAKLVSQPGQVAEEAAAIREALQPLLSLHGKMVVETQYVVSAGDIALLRGKWRCTGADPDGRSVEMQGDSTEVARRQPDGRWLYVIDHPFGAD